MVLHCHDMKKGLVYMCESCGLEIKVVKECTDCCGDDVCGCNFSCCGKELKVKK